MRRVYARLCATACGEVVPDQAPKTSRKFSGLAELIGEAKEIPNYARGVAIKGSCMQDRGQGVLPHSAGVSIAFADGIPIGCANAIFGVMLRRHQLEA